MSSPLQRRRPILRRLLDRFLGAQQAGLSGVQNILYTAYEFRGSEVEDMRRVIATRYLDGYSEGIRGMLNEYGCKTASPNAPGGSDRRALAAMVDRDVDSIRSTFNRELTNETKRLTTIQPDATRNEYRTALNEWQDNRLTSKNLTIVNASKGNAAAYAEQRFVEENNLREATFTYVGTHPNGSVLLPTSSKECIERVAASPVDWDYAEQNPTPNHANCPHRWKLIGGFVKGNCERVWRG